MTLPVIAGTLLAIAAGVWTLWAVMVMDTAEDEYQRVQDLADLRRAALGETLLRLGAVDARRAHAYRLLRRTNAARPSPRGARLPEHLRRIYRQGGISQ